MNASDAPDRSAASFIRGLTLGALIGAIIAGSSLWSLRRKRPVHARRAGALAAFRLGQPAEPASSTTSSAIAAGTAWTNRIRRLTVAAP